MGSEHGQHNFLVHSFRILQLHVCQFQDRRVHELFHLHAIRTWILGHGRLKIGKILLLTMYFGRSTYVLNQEVEKCQFLTFRVNFLRQKLSESFHFFFH